MPARVHCSICRKAFSAQASATALVDPKQFSWTNGEELLTRFQSKNGAGLQSCSRCRSTLCTTEQGRVQSLTLGCVDGDPELTLNRHLFVGSKATWETIADDVPQYLGWPPADESEGG